MHVHIMGLSLVYACGFVQWHRAMPAMPQPAADA